MKIVSGEESDAESASQAHKHCLLPNTQQNMVTDNASVCEQPLMMHVVHQPESFSSTSHWWWQKGK